MIAKNLIGKFMRYPVIGMDEPVYRKIVRAHMVENERKYALQLGEKLFAQDRVTEIPWVNPPSHELIPYAPLYLVTHEEAAKL